MTESEKPQAPEHEDEEKDDTEGHFRIAFQSDEPGAGADEQDDQDDDTQGHLRLV